LEDLVSNFRERQTFWEKIFLFSKLNTLRQDLDGDRHTNASGKHEIVAKPKTKEILKLVFILFVQTVEEVFQPSRILSFCGDVLVSVVDF